MSKHQSCQSHCCVTHGCKYGFDDCPVELGAVKQDHPCESCGYDALVVILLESPKRPTQVLQVFKGIHAEEEAEKYRKEVQSGINPRSTLTVTCHHTGKISGTNFLVEDTDI